MRFYLDEDLSQQVAEIARARGLDVVSPHECGRDGLLDQDQLRLAASESRCFVTRNYGDFALLTHRFCEMGWPHAGVLFIASSLRNDRFAEIADALIGYQEEHPEGLLAYQIDYLRGR